MTKRCTNKSSPDYKNYGARGIAICERWSKFENFLADMGQRPPGTSIDRINNDGDYEPGNCRWATREQQSTNTRRNRYVTAFGKRQTVSQWAIETGINQDALKARLDRKWPAEDALTRPMRPGHRRPPSTSSTAS